MPNVVVLGMRRSGTSLVSSLVAGMGYYFENDARPPDVNNPNGYWESKRVLELNSGLMFELGGTVDHPPAPASGWEARRSLDGLRAKARKILDSYDGHLPWGMKDTRFCFTLPFWSQLLGEDVRYILCVRNPMAVIRSWSKMSGTQHDTPDGYEAWYSTVGSALRNVADKKSLVVHYEDFTTKPDGITSEIGSFLGRELDRTRPSTFSPDLAREKPSIEELLKNPNAPDRSKRLYLALWEAGHTGETPKAIGAALDDFHPNQPPFGFRLRHSLRKRARIVKRSFSTNSGRSG